MVLCPPIGPDGTPVEIVGVDSAIIQNPKAWESSGHVGGFSDPMVDCQPPWTVSNDLSEVLMVMIGL